MPSAERRFRNSWWCPKHQKPPRTSSQTPGFTALSVVVDSCHVASKQAGFAVRPALDLAASEFFRGGKYRYADRAISPEEQVRFVERLVRDYGLFSVEDPFDEEDFGAFADLTRRVWDRCKVIGDDIFVTNLERATLSLLSRTKLGRSPRRGPPWTWPTKPGSQP